MALFILTSAYFSLPTLFLLVTRHLVTAFEVFRVIIRDIESIAEMRLVEELQKEVWEFDDREIVPLMTLIATVEVGGTLIGAFDEATLVGFVYGFIGYEGRQVTMHSDMLAVNSAYRDCNLGYQLKVAQRARTLERGISRMTWTFDPLQSRNAHLNFSKLGSIADKYKINFYGEATSSFLHQGLGTDRLWVTWLLDSDRVCRRLESAPQRENFPAGLKQSVPLLQCAADGSPQMSNLAQLASQEHALIEIPHNINSVQEQNPALATQWRDATRQAFTESLGAGFIVHEFYRSTGHASSTYLLVRHVSGAELY